MAKVSVKGTQEGLLVILDGNDLPALLEELREHLRGAASFFRGARVALQCGDLDLSPEDLEVIEDVLAESGMSLGAVVGGTAKTRAAARGLGLRVFLPRQSISLDSAEGESCNALLIHRTLRSGQSVRHPGHVVVIGDVNPGAEIIAGGDIVVWGHLRGTAHAGALGDETRSVCALDLSPTQLRIANHIARAPEERAPGSQVLPERAYVFEGRIVAEPWTGH